MFAKVKERIDGAGKAAGMASHGAGNGGDRPMPSIISRDMVVHGDMETPGEVHVEGTIRGDVRCAKLIIGANGAVNGSIQAGTVRIHGKVKGEIAADEVYLLNGSSVEGDIVQTLLEIAPGALFEGAVRRRAPASADTAPVMLAPPVETAVEDDAEKASADTADSEADPLPLDTPLADEPAAEAAKTDGEKAAKAPEADAKAEDGEADADAANDEKPVEKKPARAAAGR